MGKNHIQNNIKQFRFQADQMTQQQLADHLGVSRQTVIAIERGRYSPTLEMAFAIAALFEVELGEVFQYTAPKA